MLAEEPGAKILAGGQSLMPMLNLRVAAPPALVDINRIAELSFVTIERGEIRIGALTRHRTLETSSESTRRFRYSGGRLGRSGTWRFATAERSEARSCTPILRQNGRC